jgi:hypothetical protein
MLGLHDVMGCHQLTENAKVINESLDPSSVRPRVMEASAYAHHCKIWLDTSVRIDSFEKRMPCLGCSIRVQHQNRDGDKIRSEIRLR